VCLLCPSANGFAAQVGLLIGAARPGVGLAAGERAEAASTLAGSQTRAGGVVFIIIIIIVGGAAAAAAAAAANSFGIARLLINQFALSARAGGWLRLPAACATGGGGHSAGAFDAISAALAGTQHRARTQHANGDHFSQFTLSLARSLPAMDPVNMGDDERDQVDLIVPAPPKGSGGGGGASAASNGSARACK